MLKGLKGQSTLEYAMIIAVVVGALILMQQYMKRGVQGKLRESVDNIGGQYSAGNVKSTFTVTQTGNLVTRETFGLDDKATSFDQGVSHSKITSVPTVTRSAEGNDAEIINKKLSGETLFPVTAPNPN